MAQSIQSTIRKHLINAVAKQAGVEAAVKVADTKRAGMYTHCTLAAIAAKGDKSAFVNACDKLMTEFRANTRGIAVKYNMEQAQTKQGKPAVDTDGKPVYKVPSSLSTAKSTLGRAFDNGIALGTPAKPEAFSAIRDAASVAVQEQEAKNATPDDKIRGKIRESLTAIDAGLATLPTASLKALQSLLAKTATDIATFKADTKKAAKA